MDLKTLKLEIGNLFFEYWQQLPEPKKTQIEFMYGSRNPLDAISGWLKKEKKRLEK